MSKATYQAHLASPEWQAIKADALERAGYRCERCGSPWSLTIHHLTYDHLGQETPEQDLMILCRECHREIHQLVDDQAPGIA